MHTTNELSSEAFEYRVDGVAVDGYDVMPSVAVDDRLGVVMDDPADGLGAGNFLLACVTAFYNWFRKTREEFYEYPDYYTFQATPDPADYLEFDIWPDHKNVSVPPDPEAVLRAINDRAVTVLLVPDEPTGQPDIQDATRNSALRRDLACFAYAPDGRVADANFTVQAPRDPAWTWYATTLDALGSSPDSVGMVEDAYVSQRFREIDFEAALARLPTST
ncbi:hypothetical protein [Haladaptatus sp. NG-WS-4]